MLKPHVEEKKKGPVRYRYTGFEDLSTRGIGIRHGDVIEINEGAVTIVEHGVSDDHFAADKRFEKVVDKVIEKK